MLFPNGLYAVLYSIIAQNHQCCVGILYGIPKSTISYHLRNFWKYNKTKAISGFDEYQIERLRLTAYLIYMEAINSNNTLIVRIRLNT